MSLVYRAGINPALMQPSFRRDVEAVLGGDPDRWCVTFGYRTIDEQARLYAAYLAGGPKAAPPGKSAHNFGLAVDVVLDRDPATAAVEMDWDIRHAAWQRLFMVLAGHPRLKSGVSFGDGSHIERFQWQRFKAREPFG